MTWRSLWFFLFVAGVIGGIYSSLVHAYWTVTLAMCILSTFASLVLQFRWYQSKPHPGRKMLKTRKPARRRVQRCEETVAKAHLFASLVTFEPCGRQAQWRCAQCGMALCNKDVYIFRGKRYCYAHA